MRTGLRVHFNLLVVLQDWIMWNVQHCSEIASSPTGWEIVRLIDGPTLGTHFHVACDKKSAKGAEMGVWLGPRVEVTTIPGLYYQISQLVRGQGEGQGGCCCYAPNPLSTNTATTLFLWTFFTIDSSLNNHYSQLDMKWVDPTVPLITQSIGDHKIAVSSPEGSISKKSVTLTES